MLWLHFLALPPFLASFLGRAVCSLSIRTIPHPFSLMAPWGPCVPHAAQYSGWSSLLFTVSSVLAAHPLPWLLETEASACSAPLSLPWPKVPGACPQLSSPWSRLHSPLILTWGAWPSQPSLSHDSHTHLIGSRSTYSKAYLTFMGLLTPRILAECLRLPLVHLKIKDFSKWETKSIYLKPKNSYLEDTDSGRSPNNVPIRRWVFMRKEGEQLYQ